MAYRIYQWRRQAFGELYRSITEFDGSPFNESGFAAAGNVVMGWVNCGVLIVFEDTEGWQWGQPEYAGEASSKLF